VRYFRFHPMRHSGASILDQNRVPTSTIQKILGHEDRRTTEIYLHSLNEEERLAMAKFEQSTSTLTQHETGDSSLSVTN
jgi:integrase